MEASYCRGVPLKKRGPFRDFATLLPGDAMFRWLSRTGWQLRQRSRPGLASSTPNDWDRPHHQEGFDAWA